MIIKKILIATFLFLSIASSAFSSPLQEKVECPSAWAIKARGLGQLQDLDNGQWDAVTVNSFGTANNWTFLFGPVDASSEAEAKQMLKQALLLMVRFAPQYKDGDQTICPFISYTNKKPVFGFAINPPKQAGLDVRSLRR